MELPKITLDEFMEFDPCYTRKEVAQLMDGRESVDALEIMALDIPAKDKLWAVLREVIIPAEILHEFACRSAEETLELVGDPDPRSLEAIRVKRLWVEGKASDEELTAVRDAAEVTGRVAVWASALDAAENTERTSAWAAAEVATWAATWDTAWASAWVAAKNAAWASMFAAADDAAWVAAENAAWQTQAEMLTQMLQEYVDES